MFGRDSDSPPKARGSISESTSTEAPSWLRLLTDGAPGRVGFAVSIVAYATNASGSSRPGLDETLTSFSLRASLESGKKGSVKAKPKPTPTKKGTPADEAPPEPVALQAVVLLNREQRDMLPSTLMMGAGYSLSTAFLLIDPLLIPESQTAVVTDVQSPSLPSAFVPRSVFLHFPPQPPHTGTCIV